MKKATLFLSFLFLMVSLFVIILHNDALGKVFSCRALTVDNDCVIHAISEAIDSDQKAGAALLTQMASLRRMSLLGGDFRTYSSSLHRLGHQFLIEGQTFEKIAEVCPNLIKDGCIHGYVMEYIDRNSLSKGHELCTAATSTRVQLGCIHALGHSSLEFSTELIEQAPQSLCGMFLEREYRACVSGLLHEYSKSGQGIGHDHYYERSHDFKNISCDLFYGEDYTLCYGAQGSFRQYFPESENIRITFGICDEAKTKEAKKACRANAIQRLDIARGYSF